MKDCMTASERFKAYISGKPVDRAPVVEQAPWWGVTVERWLDEGLPKGLDAIQLQEYFGLDKWLGKWTHPFTDKTPQAKGEGLGIIDDEADYEKVFEDVSSLNEKAYLATVLSYDEDNKAKGSGRSVEGINLYDALSDSEEILTQFGGHSLAAGLSLNMDNFNEFSKRINEYIKKTYPKEPNKTLSIDCSVPPSFVTLENAKQLYRFEPYGMGNEKPVFSMNNVTVVNASSIGADNRHLSLIIESGGKNFKAVGFSFGSLAPYLTVGLRINIAFNLEINIWRGEENVQLMIKDIKKA